MHQHAAHLARRDIAHTWVEHEDYVRMTANQDSGLKQHGKNKNYQGKKEKVKASAQKAGR